MNTGVSSCGVHDGAVVSGAGKQEGGGCHSCARRGSHPSPTTKSERPSDTPSPKKEWGTPYPPFFRKTGTHPPFASIQSLIACREKYTPGGNQK